MDLKKMFEIAGVDVTSGKAKSLLEADTNVTIPLQQFLDNYPPVIIDLHMGNYDIGHSKDTTVHNAQEFLDMVDWYCEQYLSDGEVYVTPTDDPNVWSLVMTGENEDENDFDEDEGPGLYDIGWFERAKQ